MTFLGLASREKGVKKACVKRARFSIWKDAALDIYFRYYFCYSSRAARKAKPCLERAALALV